MSLLPTTVPPPSEPIGQVDQSGNVLPAKNFWLLLYNLCQNTIGIGGSSGIAVSLPGSALTELAALDADAADADAIVLRRPIDNLAKQALQPQDIVLADSDLPSISRALLWAQDGLLQDVVPRAQPVASISPTGSPFTYTAPFNGSVAITGGNVSAIALTRQGVSVSTGLTTGVIPLSRGDSAVVTYSPGAPTMTFLPA